MQNQITKSKLVLTGSSVLIGMMTSHVPVAKPKPSAETIECYILGNSYSPFKSEMRKLQLMQELGALKGQLRAKVAQYLKDKLIDKVITSCAANLLEQSRQREYRMKQDRALQLGTRPKYVNYEILKQQKQILTVEMV